MQQDTGRAGKVQASRLSRLHHALHSRVFGPGVPVGTTNKVGRDQWLEALGVDLVELVPNGSYFEYVAQELQRLPSVGRRYADSGLRRVERLAARVLLRALQRFSTHDTGSSELLCYGYHVRGVRKGESLTGLASR